MTRGGPRPWRAGDRRRPVPGFLGLCLVSLAGACFPLGPPARAPSDDAERPTRRIPPRSTPAHRPSYPRIGSRVLPSGLLLVVEQDFYATTAGVVSIVRGGSGADPEGAEGIAHLVEHLTFSAVDTSQGSPLPLAAGGSRAVRPATRRERLMRYAAAVNNGLTSRDAITFFEFGPPSRLRWLIELEGERLVNPLAGVEEKDLALERKVIASESQLRDDPRAGLWAISNLYPLIFPGGHPYTRSMNGSSATRERLHLADARAYAAKNFRPERTTLLVTMPTPTFSLDDVVAHLPKLLVGDDKHPIARPAEPEPSAELEFPAGPIIRRPSPLPVGQLWIAWPLGGNYGSRGPTQELLAHWVDADLSLDELRREDPHIRHVESQLLPGLQASALVVRVLMEEGADVDRVERIVSGRVASLWTRERGEREVVDRLKAIVAAQIVLNEPPQITRAVAQAELAAFGPILVEHRSERVSVATISTSDLAKAAYDLLNRHRPRSVLFTPAPVAPPAPERRRPQLARAALQTADDPFAQAGSWDPMELPGFRSPIKDIVVETLPTGLTTIVARRQAASVTAWLAFRGGYADADPPLLVELARRARPEAVQAPKYRALPGRFATADASIEVLEFQAENLGPALELLFEKAMVPVKDWPASDGLDRLLAPVNADVDEASLKAQQAFARALFGEHPLARVVSTADLPRVTRSAVDSWIARVHNLRNAALIVVGDVEPQSVASRAAALSKKFATPTWVDAIPTFPPPALRAAREEHLATVVTARPGALTDIHLGCQLPPERASDRAGYEMLGLAMQERLTAALRYQRGEGYELSARYEWLRNGTAVLDVWTFVDAEALTDSLAALHEHWQRWSRGGFDAGEIAVARSRYVGERSVAYQSSHAVAYHLFNDWNADPKALGQDTFRGDATAVGAERLNELFATCKANAVLGLTGNEAVIRQALAASWPKAN